MTKTHKDNNRLELWTRLWGSVSWRPGPPPPSDIAQNDFSSLSTVVDAVQEWVNMNVWAAAIICVKSLKWNWTHEGECDALRLCLCCRSGGDAAGPAGGGLGSVSVCAENHWCHHAGHHPPLVLHPHLLPDLLHPPEPRGRPKILGLLQNSKSPGVEDGAPPESIITAGITAVSDLTMSPQGLLRPSLDQ